MGYYFSKEGMRGVANEFLTGEIAYKCGNALSQLAERPLILVGRDTRVSGDMLALAFASGAISNGATVYDLGIIPTAGVAYLTKQLNATFGVMISASHNPANYNGIKIFSSKGYLVDDDFERELELKFSGYMHVENSKIGKYIQKFQLSELYLTDLVRVCKDGLYNTKITIDCANGAAYKIGPRVFSSLGADVESINTLKNGLYINDGCGSLYPEGLKERVLENKSDVGFAFDGDADRLIAVDELGNVVNGDKLLYLIATYYKNQGLLNNNIAIGTTHTNVGVQNALEEQGIKMLRSDIGDRYVVERLLKEGAVVGCEQSGHIILNNYSTSCDGILAAIIVAQILEKTGKKLSELTNIKMYPQVNLNIKVKDKLRVLNNEAVALKIEEIREDLSKFGRLVLRASETEEVIRVFAETESEEKSMSVAKSVEKFIKELNL